MPLDGGIGYLRAPPDRCSMCSFHVRTLADCLRLACACSASVPSGFSACVPLEYAFLDGIMPCVPGIHAFPHAFRGRIAHSFDALRSSFRHRSRTCEEPCPRSPDGSRVSGAPRGPRVGSLSLRVPYVLASLTSSRDWALHLPVASAPALCRRTAVPTRQDALSRGLFFLVADRVARLTFSGMYFLCAPSSLICCCASQRKFRVI